LKPKLDRNISQSFDKRSLGFVKINFQAEDFFNFLGISLDKFDARKLAKIIDIMHHQSPRIYQNSKRALYW